MSLLMFRKYAPAKAADAHIDDIAYKYKVGDKIKTPDGVGTVQKKTHTNSGKPAYEVKLDNGGIVVHVEQSVSAAHDAAQFKVGDLVRMNEGGLTGKITKIEPNGHFRVSFLYNRANGFSQSFSANEIVMVKPAKDAADEAEKIAQDSDIVALWQVLGDAQAYLREGKKNHNVKNVLAAAIKAAEKEDPNDRSVAEAKKVLAQFDVL